MDGVPLIELPVSTSHFLSPSLVSNAYTLPSSVPTYNVDCLASIDGDDDTGDCALYDHTSDPSSALIAYT